MYAIADAPTPVPCGKNLMCIHSLRHLCYPLYLKLDLSQHQNDLKALQGSGCLRNAIYRTSDLIQVVANPTQLPQHIRIGSMYCLQRISPAPCMKVQWSIKREIAAQDVRH